MVNQSVRRIEDRAERRDEVFCRTRLTMAGRPPMTATLVNLSPHGLMARADVEAAIGDPITVTLPVVGVAAATVRWSLGGRLGCSLDKAIDPAAYPAVLKAAGG